MKSKGTFQIQFIIRFVIIGIGVGLVVGMTSTFVDSFLYTVIDTDISRLNILKDIIYIFLTWLILYLTSFLTLSTFSSEAITSEGMNLKKLRSFLVYFLIAVIGIVIVYQLIHFTFIVKTRRSLEEYYNYLGKGKNDLQLNKGGISYAWSYLLQCVVKDVFMIVMIPLSRKMASKKFKLPLSEEPGIKLD